ncbi:alpha-tocopherol transfer protein-like [Glandiceps talaboti]
MMAEQASQPYKCTLSEATLKKAKEELNEDPLTREEKLNDLIEMFKTRPDIKFRQDDAFLLRFLRNKKFEVDRAFKSLVHHYQVRRDYGEIFTNYRPSFVKHFYELKSEMVCPGKDSDGRCVVLTKVELDPRKCSVLDSVRARLMMLETMLSDEDIQVNGIVYIVDSERLDMGIMKQLSPFLMKKIFDSYLKALPMRIKGGHFINQPGIFKAFYGLMKPLLPSKLKSRIHFHNDEYENLHKHIPSSILPSDLGGQILEYDNTEWVNKTLAAEEEFIYNEQFGFIKSKNKHVPGKANKTVDLST